MLSRKYVAAESDSVNLPVHYARILERLCYPGVCRRVGALLRLCLLALQPLLQRLTGIRNVEDTARTIGCMAMWFDPTTDFLEVFSHRCAADGQVVSTADYDWGDPRAVLITRQMERKLFGEGQAVGRLITDSDDPAESEAHKRVVGVLEDVKTPRQRPAARCPFFPKRPDYGEIPDMNYFIRVAGGESDVRFAEAFRERMSRELRTGNFFLKRLTPYHRYKADMDFAFGITYNYRIRLSLLVFLCVNILLCVIGTFWYRIRTRRGRSACGGRSVPGEGQVRGCCSARES